MGFRLSRAVTVEVFHRCDFMCIYEFTDQTTVFVWFFTKVALKHSVYAVYT